MFNDDWEDSGPLPVEDDYDPKAKYYKNYLIMGKFFFKIQEAAWWFVAELEDALYPYRDREVTRPLWTEGEVDVDELSYLKSQMNSANDRIERLQSEMIFVQSVINSLSDKRRSFVVKSDQTNLNERQGSSEENYQASEETS